MADHCEDYTREQLMRLLREREKRTKTTLDGPMTSRENIIWLR